MDGYMDPWTDRHEFIGLPWKGATGNGKSKTNWYIQRNNKFFTLEHKP